MEQTRRSIGVQISSQHQRNLKPKKQNYVPFLNKNKAINQKSQSTLSPGHYQIDKFYKNNNQPQLYQYYTHKPKQSVNFKSGLNRFTTSINEFPGPSTYHVNQTSTKLAKRKQIIYSQRHKRLTDSSFNHYKYPSIPTHRIKYGYKKQQNGSIIPINKSDQQLNKQRLTNKSYLRTLTYERNYQQYSDHKKKVNKKQQSKYLAFLKYTENHQQKNRQKTCHIPLKSNFYNKEKVQKVVQEYRQYKKGRGPGAYATDANHKNKDNKFEFFNSTQIRFKPCNQESSPISYLECEKNKAQHSILQIRKGLKKLKIKYNKGKMEEGMLTPKFVLANKCLNQKVECPLINRKQNVNRVGKIKKGHSKYKHKATKKEERQMKKCSEYSISEWDNHNLGEGFHTNITSTPLNFLKPQKQNIRNDI